MAPEVIPLRRSRHNIAYRCAVALQLAPPDTALDLARTIADGISPFLFAETGDRHLVVSVSPPGWIDIELTPTGLAIWLHHLRKNPVSLANCPLKPSPPDPEALFAIQYAYARCCALDRLARRAKVAVPNTPLPPPPPVLPLVGQIVTTLDVLESNRAIVPQRLSLELATAFETFYRNTPLFGDLKVVNPDTLRGILQVVFATRKLLKVLLEEGLGLLAREIL